jgi:hypothetical protein
VVVFNHGVAVFSYLRRHRSSSVVGKECLFFASRNSVTIAHMDCPHPIVLLASLALAFPLWSCRRADEPNLHDRILSANTSQYCHPPDACFNPVVLAIEDGFEVTTLQGSKPRTVHVPAKDLGKYLQSLPMQAWPQGPSIVLTRSDDVIDEKTIERNLDDARRLLQSFRLEVQFRPAG